MRSTYVADDHLADLLRVAVRAVRVHRRALRNGDRLRGAVHRGRRGVHEALRVVLVHGSEQVERAADVHVKVVDRNLARLADSLERTDEDHSIELLCTRVRRKDLVDRRTVAQVGLDQLDLAVGLVLLARIGRKLIQRKLLDATHRFLLRVMEVVEDCVSQWDTHSSP